MRLQNKILTSFLSTPKIPAQLPINAARSDGHLVDGHAGAGVPDRTAKAAATAAAAEGWRWATER